MTPWYWLAALFLFHRSLPVFAGNTYQLSNKIVGNDFYDNFNWEAIVDPTHGRVTYVDQPTSQNLNLTFTSSDTFILRTDFTTVLDPNGPGRQSVRIRSNAAYTTHVAIFSIRHMPQGCGTWPAIWTTAPDAWPNGGEIDILEGINDQAPNLSVLHSTQGCTMPNNRTMTGTPTSTDCVTTDTSNAGCGVNFPTSFSYGPSFNSVGGGWYVMERNEKSIKVWFWARSDPSVPSDIIDGASSISPDGWGIPAALFPSTYCNFPSHFQQHNIIINLTLCGDWAGSAYGQSGCPSACIDFVNNNPSAFTDAFFDFEYIRLYTP